MPATVKPGLTARMTLRRLSALAIALIVLAALGVQFWLNGSPPGLEAWPVRAWDLLRYFTILTCGLLALLMLAEALGRPVSANWQATALLSIIMVGVIFQILLAPPEPPQGLAWWPDFAFHAAVPVVVTLWWAVWGLRPLALTSLVRWLLWPIAYCAYALIRGLGEGRYAYFFLDIGQFGWARIALNIAGLVVVFAAAGLVIWIAAHLLPKSAV